MYLDTYPASYTATILNIILPRSLCHNVPLTYDCITPSDYSIVLSNNQHSAVLSISGNSKLRNLVALSY